MQFVRSGDITKRKRFKINIMSEALDLNEFPDSFSPYFTEEPAPVAVSPPELHLVPDLDVPQDHEVVVDTSDEAAADAQVLSMAVYVGGEKYYEAADPGYKKYFGRDTAISGLMSGDREMLEAQLEYASPRIGKVQDPLTGEEPDKPPHEWEGIEQNHGLLTTYNACDTAALYLQTAAALIERGGKEVVQKYAEDITATTRYIMRHVNAQGLFIEDPMFSGSTNPDGRQRHFGLKKTDWADSELNRADPDKREPNYPIVYTVAHFQNANALERIGKDTGNERMVRYARYMTEAGLRYLWNGDHFVSAVDGDGAIDAPSSDSLHALLYISPSQLPQGYADKIQAYMKQLETPAGYQCNLPAADDVDPYHMQVWPHQQALLNAAALKFGLFEAADVTRRVTPFFVPKLGIFPECIDPNTLQPSGNIKQLWAIKAYLYFLHPERSQLY